jgi:UPF0716 protein FxsA
MPFPKWPLLFVVVPVLELFLLIRVGMWIGAGWTVLLVLTTALVGVTLLRWQGIATLARGVERLQQGQVPAGEMVEGMLLAVAGGMLLTPGFITDAAGFLLMLRPARQRISQFLLSRLRIYAVGPPGGTPPPAGGRGRIIDGDFERRDDP